MPLQTPQLDTKNIYEREQCRKSIFFSGTSMKFEFIAISKWFSFHDVNLWIFVYVSHQLEIIFNHIVPFVTYIIYIYISNVGWKKREKNYSIRQVWKKKKKNVSFDVTQKFSRQIMIYDFRVIPFTHLLIPAHIHTQHTLHMRKNNKFQPFGARAFAWRKYVLQIHRMFLLLRIFSVRDLLCVKFSEVIKFPQLLNESINFSFV